jgi:hypothetical protein
MFVRPEPWWCLASLPLSISVLGCSAVPDPPTELDGASVSSEPIIGGKPATAYPEAVLISLYQGGHGGSVCSGSVIAPRVVLTAGHCVHGFNGWRITAPFAGGQVANSGKAYTYDWTNDGPYVDPGSHDVGIVVLDAPIQLAAYPAIADFEVKDGGPIVNVGRIRDGQLSTSALFVSPPITVFDGAQIGFPYSYGAVETIQPGDSGGPDFLSGTHTIVAVNSGAGGGTEVLARVDLLYTWIQAAIAENGGGGNVDGGTGAEPGGEGGGEVPSGPSEVEPNDVHTAANPLGASVSGKLGGSDQDWFTWKIDGSSYYELSIHATGDAEIAMWKLVGGHYYQVPNATPTSFAHTSTGAGQYFVAAWSPLGQEQTYTITLAR